MTNKEILKRAMQKARVNGWSKGDGWFSIEHAEAHDFMIIFSHDFAKSFWGEEWPREDITQWFPDVKPWQWYLQKMVLQDDPIKYLEQFI